MSDHSTAYPDCDAQELRSYSYIVGPSSSLLASIWTLVQISLKHLQCSSMYLERERESALVVGPWSIIYVCTAL